MALSYYSNWESFQKSDTDMAFLNPDLQTFPDACNYDDYFFDTNDLFPPENLNSLLPFDNTNAIATDPFSLHQQLDPFPYPKRQKLCDFEQYTDEFNPMTFFNGFVSPPETAMLPLPEFPISYTKGISGDESVKKETNLSAQSIAARQRRRRITEKTQELGKLVPGGPKMNTAEMLQAAYKYIKYLQAQLGVLQFIASNNQEAPLASSEELHLLLQSPLIQEKLYSTENCLLPLKCVEQLGTENPSLKKEL